MGLLRDTYNITEINTSGVICQMARQNDILEEGNKLKKQDLQTKDRVDISLKEYKELQEKAELLRKWDNFAYMVERCTGLNSEKFLKGRVIRADFDENYCNHTQMTAIVLEFKPEDLI